MTVARNAGAAAAWSPSILEDGARNWEAPIEDWYVGTPGMSGIVRPLARTLDVRTGTFVNEFLRRDHGWELETDTGRRLRTVRRRRCGNSRSAGAFTPGTARPRIPPPHLRADGPLLVTHGFVRACAAGRERRIPLDSGAARARRARGKQAPGDLRIAGSWVIHATSQWSREHLEADAQEAAQLILHAFATAVGSGLPAPAWLNAHRWRHARVEQPLGLPCLLDADLAAGACGDWCIAPRVEAAFESGRAMAHSLLSMLGKFVPLSPG